METARRIWPNQADREEATRQQKIKEKNDRAETPAQPKQRDAEKREKQRAKEAKEQRAGTRQHSASDRREAREAKAQKPGAPTEAERIAKLKRDEPIHRRWEAEARAIVQPLMIRTKNSCFT